jgi:RNA polymerase sigma factor (sigma-70 family)
VPDVVSHWLTGAGRVPMLTPSQEITLGEHVRAWLDHPGGPEDCPPEVRRRGLRARDRLVRANLRLVVAVAKKYRGKGESLGLAFEDLLQEGALGLQRGAEKFEPAKGYKFSTYSYWWIQQALRRAIAYGGLIRCPTHAQEKGAKPDAAALVVRARQVVSFDAPAGAGEDRSSLVELLAAPEPEPSPGDGQLVEDVNAALDRLPPEDADLLRQRMDGRTFVQIGEQRGVSRTRVQQQETRARARLAAVPGLRELLAG